MLLGASHFQTLAQSMATKTLIFAYISEMTHLDTSLGYITFSYPEGTDMSVLDQGKSLVTVFGLHPGVCMHSVLFLGPALGAPNTFVINEILVARTSDLGVLAVTWWVEEALYQRWVSLHHHLC